MNLSNNTSIYFLFSLLIISVYIISLGFLNSSDASCYLLLSAGLFSIGLFGLFTSKSLIKTLICLELLFNAASINFLGFNYYADYSMLRGQLMILFIMAIAAAEIAIGLALCLLIYSKNHSIKLKDLNTLRD